MPQLEVDDIQGIIISGYKRLHYSCYLFLRLDNPIEAKKWLWKLISSTQSTDPNIKITTADSPPKKLSVAINIAFTFLGLRRLGLPESTLNSFPKEFSEGMAAPNRARLLGDVGHNSPDHWDVKYRMADDDNDIEADECHVLLILQAKSEDELKRLKNHHCKLMKPFSVKPLLTHYGQWSSQEHFGFQDGISQPEIEGHPALTRKLVNQPALQREVVKAGEFILGYENEDNLFPDTPTVKENPENRYLQPAPGQPELSDLGRNGSYLVWRKLSQDVSAFCNYLKEHSPDIAEQNRVAAKMVGRWRSGAPLVFYPQSDPYDPYGARLSPCKASNSQENPQARFQVPPESEEITANQYSQPENRFGYRTLDLNGFRCPLGAHIRRANPRDSLGKNAQDSLKIVKRHRILRRGVIYDFLPLLAFWRQCYCKIQNRLPSKAEDFDLRFITLAYHLIFGGDQGLLFICINANIQRQFEFVQKDWINNSKFAGLYNETDPIMGLSQTAQPRNDMQDSGLNNQQHGFILLAFLWTCYCKIQNNQPLKVETLNLWSISFVCYLMAGEPREFTIQSSPVRQRLHNLPDFVTLKGGGYFFLPGISALKFIANYELSLEAAQGSENAPSVFKESS